MALRTRYERKNTIEAGTQWITSWSSKVLQRLLGVCLFIQTLLEGVNGQCPAGGEESYKLYHI